MKIAIFPCNNGLGHIKRSFEIANKINNKVKVDFFTKDITKNKFKKNKNLSIKKIKNPKNLNEFKKSTYPKWVKDLDLNKYDFIYSDTLPELVLKRNRIIIFANFFWDKIFKIKNKIFKKIDKKLILNKIYTNYLFYHKPSMKEKKIIKIGFFGKFSKKKFLENNNVLISLGTAKLINSKKIVRKIKNIINKEEDYNFYIDKNYYKFFKNLKNVYAAKHDKKMFEKISIAIIKPGFSIISECLRNGVPIFCFDNMQNDEFKYNSKIILKNKLGYKENNLEKLFYKALNTNTKTKKKLFKKYKLLKWSGEMNILNEFKK